MRECVSVFEVLCWSYVSVQKVVFLPVSYFVGDSIWEIWRVVGNLIVVSVLLVSVFHDVKESNVFNGRGHPFIIFGLLEHVATQVFFSIAGQLIVIGVVNFLNLECVQTNWIGCPSSEMNVWRVFIVEGLWAFPRQASPTMTHPRSSFWAYRALWGWGGALICLRTLCTLRMSHPSRSIIGILGSKVGMRWAIVSSVSVEGLPWELGY